SYRRCAGALGGARVISQSSQPTRHVAATSVYEYAGAILLKPFRPTISDRTSETPRSRSDRTTLLLFHQFKQPAELLVDLAELESGEFGRVGDALFGALRLVMPNQR